MTVTSFVPTLPKGPSSGAAPAGKAGKGSSPAEETETSEAEGFLATLSDALAAVVAQPAVPQPVLVQGSVAPSGTQAGGPQQVLAQAATVVADGALAPTPSGVAEPHSALAVATPREVPGSGGSSLAAGLPGTVPPLSDLAGASPGTSSGTSPASPASPDPTAGLAVAPSADPTPRTTHSDQATSRPTLAGTPLGVAAAAGSGDASGAASGGGDHAGSDGGQPAAPATPMAPSVGGSTGPVADVAPRTSAERTSAVLRQVFPEVTRVAAQAGPGTHRLSITLNPETLGEVKVTLLVRAGAVHVSLAAQSGAAHDALLQGAPELHRLLEVTGGDARVVVRDAASSAGSTGSGTTDQRGAEQRGQQAAYGPSAGDGQGSRDGRSPARTAPGAPLDEHTDLRGDRPGRPTGAASTGTAVHPGRLDRLM